jgi:hypothetical protein
MSSKDLQLAAGVDRIALARDTVLERRVLVRIAVADEVLRALGRRSCAAAAPNTG